MDENLFVKKKSDILRNMNTGKVFLISFFVSLVVSVSVVFGFNYLMQKQSLGGFSGVDETAKIPHLTNMSVDQASQLVQNKGLLLVVAGQKEDEDVKKGLIVSQQPLHGSIVEKGTTMSVIISSGKPSAEVPQIVGLLETDAVKKLAEAGLEAGAVTREQNEEVQKDQVISSDPPAGKKVDASSAVKLVVSEGPEGIEVPDLKRKKLGAAKQLIKKAGFEVGEIDFYDDPDVAGGSILKQIPPAGSMAPKGSPIDLKVNTF